MGTILDFISYSGITKIKDFKTKQAVHLSSGSDTVKHFIKGAQKVDLKWVLENTFDAKGII